MSRHLAPYDDRCGSPGRYASAPPGPPVRLGARKPARPVRSLSTEIVGSR